MPSLPQPDREASLARDLQAVDAICEAMLGLASSMEHVNDPQHSTRAAVIRQAVRLIKEAIS